MTPEDRHAYDEHVNAVMIQNDVLDSAKLEGRMEGHMEGLAEGEAKGKAEANLENAQEDESYGDRS